MVTLLQYSEQKEKKNFSCPLLGVPQTPVVESIEPTPDVDGDIVVNVVIPSVDGFDDIPADLVTFTVVATLQPDGTMTSPVMVTVSNYFYGNVIMVMVSGLMVGRDYVFTVSASNMFGDSDTSESVPMEIVGETTESILCYTSYHSSVYVAHTSIVFTKLVV